MTHAWNHSSKARSRALVLAVFSFVLPLVLPSPLAPLCPRGSFSDAPQHACPGSSAFASSPTVITCAKTGSIAARVSVGSCPSSLGLRRAQSPHGRRAINPEFVKGVTAAGRLRDSMGLRMTADVDVTGDGGCIKRIIQEGRGSDRPGDESIVRIHYKIKAEGELVASTEENGQEFSFELGITPSDAMPGWESAIPTMLEGEVAEVTCSPEYAYGAAGAPPLIPPNATLFCEIRLVGWQEASDMRVSLAEKYTPSDAPEDEIYDKYKNDMASGETLKDEGLNPAGKKPEVWKDMDDVRLKKLTRRDQRVAGKGAYQGTNVTWIETEKAFDLFVPLPAKVKSGEVECEIKQSRIRLGIKGDKLLFEGNLRGKVSVDESLWVIDEDEVSKKGGGGGRKQLHVSLVKLKPYLKIWGGLLETPKKEGKPGGDEDAAMQEQGSE